MAAACWYLNCKMASLFRILTNTLLTIASLAYPLGWLFLESRENLQGVVGVMAILWGMKAIQAVRSARFFAILMTVLLSLVFFTQHLGTMYWYPVIINAAMLALFGGSLFSAQPIIERLARLQDPNLPPQAVRYTRKVTQIWCGFFVFNILICTALIATQQYEWWAIYSGGISYGLMGVLMVGEWLVRQRIQKTK